VLASLHSRLVAQIGHWELRALAIVIRGQAALCQVVSPTKQCLDVFQHIVIPKGAVTWIFLSLLADGFAKTFK